MASSGKKGKKTKGKTLALNDFLQETPGATPTIPIRKTNLNWADEVEDIYDQFDGRPKANVVLPTAPKASRGFDEFSEKIPQQPPYIAYLSNLPYDVNEDEIADFFAELKISNMRIPKDDRPGETPRLKGYGYVEFVDREGLVGALSITDCTLKNRRIRIEIATNLDNNDRRRGGRMDNNRDRGDRSEVTSGDWRSGPRADPPEPERERNRNAGFGRDRDNVPFERDRGSWRDGNDRPNFREMDRDRGYHRDSERGGFRDNYGDRSRFNDREDKRSFGSRRGDRDDKDSFSRGGSRDDGGSERSEPRTRPKLVLAPRSKPSADSDQEISQEIIPDPVPASSSIFGNAKPVDTSIRERQIEDRLAKLNEKTTNEPSRESRRDTDRKDWGKREQDVRWSQDRKRESPKRTSPRRYSPRRGSSEYRDVDDYSPHRNQREDSPENRKSSPDGSSRDDRKRSPERRKRSPEYKRNSPNHYRRSPDHTKGSSDRKWTSPEHRKGSPPRKRESPDRTSSARSYQRKGDDKRGSTKSDRSNQKNDKEKSKRDDRMGRDNYEREMSKLKEPEPPNFIASNKYAFLKAEDDSD